MRNAGRSGFVDEAADAKALELEGLGQFVVLAGGQQMRQRPAADRYGLEAPRAPAAAHAKKQLRMRSLLPILWM